MDGHLASSYGTLTITEFQKIGILLRPDPGTTIHQPKPRPFALPSNQNSYSLELVSI